MWKKHRNMACMGIVGAALFGVGDWLIYLNVKASFYLRDHMFHAFPVYPVCRESKEAYHDILEHLRKPI